jgi:hypothetical protein
MRKVSTLSLTILMVVTIFSLTANLAAAQTCSGPTIEEATEYRTFIGKDNDYVEAMKDRDLTPKEVLGIREWLQAKGLLEKYDDDILQKADELESCTEVPLFRARLNLIRQKMQDQQDWHRLNRKFGRRNPKSAEESSAVVTLAQPSQGLADPGVTNDALARIRAKLAADQERLRVLRQQQAVQAEFNRLQPQGSAYYVPAANQGLDVLPAQPRQPAQPQEPEPSYQGLGNDAPLVYWTDTTNVNFNVDNPEDGSYMKEEGGFEDIIDPEYKEDPDDDHTVYRRTRTVDKTYRFGRE